MGATDESMQLPPLPSLAGMDALPTLPVVAIRLGEIVHSRNVSVQQVAELLRGDPATSAKLLRLVNSPYFGIPGGVADVARAIPFIGFSTLYQLVLSITVIEALGGKDSAVRALWIHSLSVATTARELAVEAKVDPGAAFTAGLLHEMGNIALAKLDPTSFEAATERARAGNLSMDVAEQQLGLPSHARVGAALAKQWRFPAALAVPIEQHHAIHRAAVRGKLAATLRNLTEVLAGADWLAHATARTFDGRSETPDEPEALALFERVGLSAAQRQAVSDRAKLALEKSKIFLAVLD